MALLYENLKLSEVRDVNPDTGATLVKTYTGTKAQMLAVQEYWRTLNFVDNTATGRGYKTTLTSSAVGYFLVVRVPDDILYTDRWDLDTETVSVDMWWSRDVKNHDALLAALDVTTVAGMRSYMRRIGLIQAAKNAIMAGADPDLVLVGAPAEVNAAFTQTDIDLIFLMIKDGGFIEQKRPVLKRNRTIPFLVAGNTTLTGPTTIYTTEALIDVFGIPDEVVAQIETVDSGLPTTFPNFAWGWKERRNDSSNTIGFSRVSECRDWVFGNWSTITHSFVL